MTAATPLDSAIHAEPGMTGWAERGWLPDAALRWGMRRLCAQRLVEES